MPVPYVNWGDAARFCNWLQNGQPSSGTEGTGTTETGAYTLNGDVLTLTESRNAGATYFIPSENEWYKAAYYKSGGTDAGYWLYPTRSNTAPDNSLMLATSESNDANYSKSNYTDPTNYLTPVGTFVLSLGPYGTFDQGGDLYQWNEARISGTNRGVRGGSFPGFSGFLLSSNRSIIVNPTLQVNGVGFRVASSVAVPEPGSIALMLAGGVFVLAFARRRWAATVAMTGAATAARRSIRDRRPPTTGRRQSDGKLIASA